MQSEALNHWHFVIAAYAVGGGAIALLVAQSWWAMRRAEARRDRARGDRREKGPGGE